MERYTLFWGKMPPFPPKKKTASAAKPILACLYKTLTFMLYNLINHPNLMGAHRSCGQFKNDVPDHEEQLMTCIVNMMNYNQLPHECEKRDNNNNN
jgi:hypothetical protein